MVTEIRELGERLDVAGGIDDHEIVAAVSEQAFGTPTA